MWGAALWCVFRSVLNWFHIFWSGVATCFRLRFWIWCLVFKFYVPQKWKLNKLYKWRRALWCLPRSQNLQLFSKWRRRHQMVAPPSQDFKILEDKSEEETPQIAPPPSKIDILQIWKGFVFKLVSSSKILRKWQIWRRHFEQLSASHHQKSSFQLGCATIGVAATSKNEKSSWNWRRRHQSRRSQVENRKNRF